MRYAALLAALTLPAAACSHTPSRGPDSSDIAPLVQAYTEAEQDQAAREIVDCTACEMLKRFMADYLVMRDETRAMKSEEK